MHTNQLKVALVHDWLLTDRGGERVLRALCEMFSGAPIFTLFHKKGSVDKTIESHPIQTSFLDRIPGAHRFHRHLLPLFPLAIERLVLEDFDLVISSSHCVAKGVIVPPDTVHISYTHTPMRYAWDRYHDYFDGRTEPLLAPVLHYLRQWDVTASARVDHFVANSNWVKARILKYYRRNSEVVFPFVDLNTFSISERKRDGYYLVVSAFAPYKRIDLALEACRKLDRRLVVVGTGQDNRLLRKLGRKKVEFLGNLESTQLTSLYQNASALLFPGEEDFGITPLEAMAAGTPVIAFGRGGVMDSVVPNRTGILFPRQSVESLSEAIEDFESGIHTITPKACRAQAELFSEERFKREIAQVVKYAMSGDSGDSVQPPERRTPSFQTESQPPMT